VAVSSFGSFRQKPSAVSNSAPNKKYTAQAPPEYVRRHQSNATALSISRIANLQEKEGGDELFAKPLSPRTPDVTRSPFSFSSKETLPYLNGRKGSKD
jgi:hypothetical protein